jgi:hypothetical protein
MFRKLLVCSFCRRSAAEVAKLVAGPRRCAAEAIRIMNDSADDQPLFEPLRSDSSGALARDERLR